MESQYRALLAFKAAVAGRYGERDLPSWKPSKTAAAGGYCRWKGVECNRRNLVVEIGLQEMGLGGVLPPASVLQPLTVLRALYLGRNGMDGTLPGSWSTLTKLVELDLGGLDLTGTLPPSWGALKHMQRLWLDAEGPGDLSGTLPGSWSGMSHLIQLTLDGHGFNGTLPPAWGALKQLDALALSDNNLSGPLPSAWSGMSSLTGISLSRNALTGTLPLAWGALRKLQSLFLDGNNLSGTVPRAWQDGMADLNDVRLHKNHLAGCTDPERRGTYPRAGPTVNSPRIFC